MRHFLLYIPLFAIIILFGSCEKSVDLDLRSIEPRLVIDASIQNDLPCEVILTKTRDYYDNSICPTVSGAVIQITDSDGNSDVLEEVSPGRYTLLYSPEESAEKPKTIGRTNIEYTLSVKVEGVEYVAKATIPPVVSINKLFIYDIAVGDEHYYSPCVVFDDPAYEANYYYYILYVNDMRMRSIYIDDDKFFNGLTSKNRILFFDKEDNMDEELKIGDHVRVEMQSLDKSAYKFYQTLFSVAAGGGTNPTGNFSGDVLGCFKAYGISEATIYGISWSDVFDERQE